MAAPRDAEGSQGLLVAFVLVLVAAVIHAIHAARRARREREKALALLAALPGYVALLDARGAIVAKNRAWQALEPSHPLARCGVGDTLDGACPLGELVAERVSRVGRGEARKERVEVILRGSPEVFFDVRIRRLDPADGALVISCVDVSRRRRAEEEARRAREALSHMERVAAAGELAAAIAHELSQPLAAIHTNAYVVKKLLTGPAPDIAQAIAIVDDIRRDDRRASEVIKRLRTLLEPRPTNMLPLDLNDVAREVVRFLGNDALLRGVALSIDTTSAPLVVRGDAVQLQQIVLNFVTNAFAAVAAKPAEERVVEVVTRQEGQGAEIQVRDSGTGIQAAEPERVFEAFFTTKEGGLGLGLAICRTIAEVHRGAITATSAPGKGATFRLCLPLAATSEPPPRPSDEPTPMSGR